MFPEFITLYTFTVKGIGLYRVGRCPNILPANYTSTVNTTWLVEGKPMVISSIQFGFAPGEIIVVLFKEDVF